MKKSILAITVALITGLMLSSFPHYANADLRGDVADIEYKLQELESRLRSAENQLELITHPCGIWRQHHVAFAIARASTTAEQRQKLVELQAKHKVECYK